MDPDQRKKKTEYLTNLLKYPGESPDCDFKSSVQFDSSNEFSVKLVRHILGMANSGGGHIVIGYNEKLAKPVPDNGLTAQIVASYETTKLSQFVDSHLFSGGEKISLVVWKIPHQNQDYPIIEIFGFLKQPLFCNSTKLDKENKSILKEHALYIRDQATRTVELGTPQDWNKLIDLCVKNRQDELLVRFKSLTEEIGLVSPNFTQQPPKIGIESLAPDTTLPIPKLDPLKSWSEERRERVQDLLELNKLEMAYLEVIHTPINNDGGQKWKHKELLEAADKSMLRNTGWPIGIVLTGDPRTTPVPDGIETTIPPKTGHIELDYWYLREDGAYYFARSFEEDRNEEQRAKKLFWADTKVWRVAEGIDHCIALYQKLGVSPNTKIFLSIAFRGIAGRLLTAASPSRLLIWERRNGTSVDSVNWEVETTLDSLLINRAEYAEQALAKVFTMFDLFELDHGAFESILKEYETSSL